MLPTVFVLVVVVIGAAVWKTEPATVNLYVGKLKSIVGVVNPSFEAGLIVDEDKTVGFMKDWTFGIWKEGVIVFVVWKLGIWIDGMSVLVLLKGVKEKGLDDLMLILVVGKQ